MAGQMDVMVSTTKEGHFADNQGDELVFDPDTGAFTPSPGDTSDVSSPATASTAAATEVQVQQAVPAQQQPARTMDVMRSVTKDGHFADIGRLKLEVQALNKTFPTNKKRLSTTEATMLYKNKYTVLVTMSEAYPNEMPRCYLANKDLRFRNGGLVKNMGTSHEYHLLETVNGRAQICHGKKSHWKPNKSLASVFVKAFMWIEAYENHLKTGNSLDTYLRTQGE